MPALPTAGRYSEVKKIKKSKTIELNAKTFKIYTAVIIAKLAYAKLWEYGTDNISAPTMWF